MLKKLAQEALFVQDACNLSGVVHAFSRALTVLRAMPECAGTYWLNTHPICIMYASKIASLTGVELDGSFSSAYDNVKRMAE